MCAVFTKYTVKNQKYIIDVPHLTSYFPQTELIRNALLP
jgi:hypothetical protein